MAQPGSWGHQVAPTVPLSCPQFGNVHGVAHRLIEVLSAAFLYLLGHLKQAQKARIPLPKATA